MGIKFSLVNAEHQPLSGYSASGSVRRSTYQHDEPPELGELRRVGRPQILGDVPGSDRRG